MFYEQRLTFGSTEEFVTVSRVLNKIKKEYSIPFTLEDIVNINNQWDTILNNLDMLDDCETNRIKVLECLVHKIYNLKKIHKKYYDKVHVISKNVYYLNNITRTPTSFSLKGSGIEKKDCIMENDKIINIPGSLVEELNYNDEEKSTFQIITNYLLINISQCNKKNMDKSIIDKFISNFCETRCLDRQTLEDIIRRFKNVELIDYNE